MFFLFHMENTSCNVMVVCLLDIGCFLYHLGNCIIAARIQDSSSEVYEIMLSGSLAVEVMSGAVPPPGLLLCRAGFSPDGGRVVVTFDAQIKVSLAWCLQERDGVTIQ